MHTAQHTIAAASLHNRIAAASLQHPIAAASLRQAPPRGNRAVLAERPQGAEQAQKE